MVSDREGRGPDDPTLGPEDLVTISSSDLTRDPEPSGLRPGARFADYRLLRVLGEGGFGQVWEAASLDTGRHVAVKVLVAARTASAESIERFKREGRLAASLNHPRCVFVFRADEAGGLPFIAMEQMTGGTLQDRIDAAGPLAPAAAVDRILEILDGLEAAHAKGILHRDLKPSNCFLDSDGRAKIGDFGLSRTLEGDASLTATGSFLGTPYYSSPEQVRGRDVDFQSDFYSLGATLYALLTGDAPFHAEAAGEALARILSEPPEPIPRDGVNVPKGLQRLVMRMLAKDKRKRFGDHAALRAALTPYSSQQLSAAGLARRLAAILLDHLVWVPLNFLLVFGAVTGDEPHFLLLVVPWVPFTYLFVWESVWGRSLGKRLTGVRVVGRDGSRPPWVPVLVRTAVFVGLYTGPGILMAFFPVVLPAGLQQLAMTLIGYSGLLPLLATMRRGNGYAGLHELASGTRVVEVERREEVVVPSMEPGRSRPAGSPRQAFGPFRVVSALWTSGTEALLIGEDEALGRRVWIHTWKDETSPRTPQELAVLRPGRLRWLQGCRDTGDVWDAFEAPTGLSLVRWVDRAGRLSWTQFRGILLGLADEIAAGREAEDLPARLSLGQVWVDAQGGVKLLDFPGGDATEPAWNPQQWLPFLRGVSSLALTGRSPEQGEGAPPVPMPEHVRAFMGRLFETHETPTGLDGLRAELREISTRPATIPRVRRAVGFAPVVMLYALMVLAVLSVDQLMTLQPLWMLDLIEVERRIERLRKLDAAGDGDGHREEREAIRMVLADGYLQAQAEAGFGRQMVAGMPAEIREVVDAAVRDYPALTEEQVATARLLVPAPEIPEIGAAQSFVGMSVMVVFLAIPAVAVAFLARGSLMLLLSGIVVQTRDGRRAGRLRCLARSFVAWSPMLTFVLLMTLGGGDGMAVPFKIPLVLWTIMVAGAAYAILHPERGLQDRIAGTFLVRR